MHSTTYMLGFWCGIVLVAVFTMLFRMFMNKKLGQKAAEYDERQAAIRGKGFQIAYFTALVVLVFGGTAEMAFGAAWCTLFVLAMLALWISICVFVTYCVVKDAYFTLRSRRRALIIIMAAAGIINLFVTLINGNLTENGQLSTGFVNLLTSACCLYMAIMMLVWTMHERRQVNDE